MRSCPQITAFTASGKAVCLRCGQWHCEYCRIVNAKQWALRTLKAFPDGGEFMTLTQSNRVRTVSRAYQLMPGQWDTFRKAMQRQSPDGWRYIAFVEGQPERSNMPHFHIIASAAPRPSSERQAVKTALANMARRSGFGWIVDYQRVRDKGAAFYVAKYASKAAPDIPKGFRRVRTSQHFPALDPLVGEPLIMAQPSEKLAAYIVRVSEITGTMIDNLTIGYQNAQMEFNQHSQAVLDRHRLHTQRRGFKIDYKVDPIQGD